MCASPSYGKDHHSRIAFLGVDQVRNFEVQGEVGLVVRDIAGMSYSGTTMISNAHSYPSGLDYNDVRTARWTGESPRSAKAPKRSLAAMRAEAASRVTTRKLRRKTG